MTNLANKFKHNNAKNEEEKTKQDILSIKL